MKNILLKCLLSVLLSISFSLAEATTHYKCTDKFDRILYMQVDEDSLGFVVQGLHGKHAGVLEKSNREKDLYRGTILGHDLTLNKIKAQIGESTPFIQRITFTLTKKGQDYIYPYSCVPA